MGADVNAGLWSAGPHRLVTQSRYAALMAIMHGRRLYERGDPDAAPAGQAAAIRAFLERARELEDSLLASLRADPATARHAGAESVARNSQLVWTWDLISLALLLDWAPLRLESVPAATGSAVDVTLEVVPPGVGEPRHHVPAVSLDPWPFAAPAVRLHCEGRRLTERFASDEALADGLATAPWETVEFELVGRVDSRRDSTS
jgi:Protein of unknown function (DUF3891)